MSKPILTLLFFGGFVISALSFFYTPVTCVQESVFEGYWYEYGLFFGLTIMAFSLLTYLLSMPQQNKLDEAGKK